MRESEVAGVGEIEDADDGIGEFGFGTGEGGDFVVRGVIVAESFEGFGEFRMDEGDEFAVIARGIPEAFRAGDGMGVGSDDVERMDEGGFLRESETIWRCDGSFGTRWRRRRWRRV